MQSSHPFDKKEDIFFCWVYEQHVRGHPERKSLIWEGGIGQKVAICDDQECKGRRRAVNSKVILLHEIKVIAR